MLVRVFNKKTLTEKCRHPHVIIIEEMDCDKTIQLTRYNEAFCPEEVTICISPNEYIEVSMEDE